MKILIIEDDAIVAVMQKMWITKACQQCNAQVFSNGLEAIKFLDQDLEETPDEDYLIFLDINMPVMNGWEFLEACENRWYVNRLAVVIVTSSGFEEDFLKAKKISLVLDYQTKPIDAEKIPGYIRNVKKDLSYPGFPDVNLN